MVTKHTSRNGAVAAGEGSAHLQHGRQMFVVSAGFSDPLRLLPAV